MPINPDKSSLSVQCPNCLQKRSVYKKIDAKFSLYFCNNCHNGFTYPVPKHIEKYYHRHYWTSSTLVGNLKDVIFNIFQRRRVSWVTKTISEGTILDVGSGEGKFGITLPQAYQVVSIEPSTSKVKSKSVVKKDFLKWKTKQKFGVVTFWESLEHTPWPQQYLSKAYKLLKKGGFIFVEFPRYNSLESRMFGKNWFHLDPPRHLSHLTDKGLVHLLTKAGFSNIALKSVPSFDYAPWGFVASTLNSFGICSTDYIKKTGNLFYLALLLPLAFISLLVEVGLIIIKQSPIGLATAQKT
jgi:SAM-dependent methyltransferase